MQGPFIYFGTQMWLIFHPSCGDMIWTSEKSKTCWHNRIALTCRFMYKIQRLKGQALRSCWWRETSWTGECLVGQCLQAKGYVHGQVTRMRLAVPEMPRPNKSLKVLQEFILECIRSQQSKFYILIKWGRIPKEIAGLYREKQIKN